MFRNKSNIQSKTSFEVQQCTHRLLTQLKMDNSPLYQPLLSTHKCMNSIMANFHELPTLNDQIKAYDIYSLQLARTTAIIDQVPDQYSFYPGKSEFQKRVTDYYLNIVKESSKKRNFLYQLKELNLNS